MVDQLRAPLWLTSSEYSTVQSICPNIFGADGIYGNSVVFYQYCVAAAACTPSRSCILTGLYTPQTAQYITGLLQAEGPPLDPNYPTFGWGLQHVNSNYANNCWWIGKWHLSYPVADGTSQPLAPYGFNTQTIPGPTIPSPDGYENEGSEGGTYTCYNPLPHDYHGVEFASDAQIAADFASWYTSNAESGQWCTVVSFVNPHDISDYDKMLMPPACGLPYPKYPYFSTPPGPSTDVYTAVPSPWNHEFPSVVMDPSSSSAVKPALQWDQFVQTGEVTSYIALLNWYYYLVSLVDYQVGQVLATLNTMPEIAENTIVVFTSDHGEYGGSHGLRAKGGAVYDEAMRVPLCVMLPSMYSATRYQLCSAVDFFGLICDLGTGGSGSWRTAYPNLANRESIYSFLMSGSAPESYRLLSDETPYILHTTDEEYPVADQPDDTFQAAQPAGTNANNHVVAIRTKTDFPSTFFSGAKFAVYTHWADCTLVPDSGTPDYEFYDYGNTLYNRAETSNNDPSETDNTDPDSVALRNELKAALGDYGTNVGLIQTELNATLTGNGVDGVTPLTTTLAGAQEAYLTMINGGSCS